MVRYNVHTCADPYKDNPIEYERKRKEGRGVNHYPTCIILYGVSLSKVIAVFVLGIELFSNLKVNYTLFPANFAVMVLKTYMHGSGIV